jgi:4-amino-4-deoxy-L-arabinose transferase-like glycosyltransferase
MADNSPAQDDADPPNLGSLQTRKQSGRTAAFAVALALLGCAAATSVLVATATWGIGLSNDSASYVQGARNLLAGHGVSWQSADGALRAIHFPPLYSIVLALPAFVLGLDVVESARYVNALLAALNVCLVAMLIYHLSERARLAWLFGALLVLTNLTLLPLQTTSLSEPLFLCLVLATLLALVYHLKSSSLVWLVASATFAALALLTRYAGVALVITGFGTIVLLSWAPLWTRLTRALLFGISAVLPLGAWLFANQRALAETTGRQLALHVPTRANFDGIQQAAGWLVPSTIAKPLATWVLSAGTTVRIGLGLAVAVLAIGLVAFALRSRVSQSSRYVLTPSLLAVCLFIPVYLVVMLMSILLFDAATSLNGRILSPAYEAAVVVCCTLAAAWARHVHLGRPAVAAATVGLAAVALVHVFGAGLWLATTRQDGQGYSGQSWRASPTLANLSSLPAGTRVYSNVVGAVYCVTGRLSNDIPVRIDPRSRQADPQYDIRMAALRGQLAAEPQAVVVLLTMADGADLYPVPEELARTLDLQLVAADADGAIYRPGVRREG